MWGTVGADGFLASGRSSQGDARSGREYGFPLPPVKQSFPATLSQQGAPLPDVELTPLPRTGSNCLNHPWSSGPATLH